MASEGMLSVKLPKFNERVRCVPCGKKTHWRRSGVFIVNFEQISHLVLVFLLLSLNMPGGYEWEKYLY